MQYDLRAGKSTAMMWQLCANLENTLLPMLVFSPICCKVTLGSTDIRWMRTLTVDTQNSTGKYTVSCMIVAEHVAFCQCCTSTPYKYIIVELLISEWIIITIIILNSQNREWAKLDETAWSCSTKTTCEGGDPLPTDEWCGWYLREVTWQEMKNITMQPKNSKQREKEKRGKREKWRRGKREKGEREREPWH